MKKFIKTILLPILVLFLVSCNESTTNLTEPVIDTVIESTVVETDVTDVITDTSNATKLSEVMDSITAYSLLTIDEDPLNVTNNLNFITEKDGVSITYESDNIDAINNEGEVTRIFEFDIEVNITLTFELGELKDQKTFIFKVIQKENYGILEDGIYNTRDEVAIYIFLYNKLPSNYVKKDDIDGHIRQYWTKFNKLSIGGDIFYNREGLLPSAEGRTFIEVDIDYAGSSRNSKRIVYSNDGLIFYTDDHYESFLMFDTEDFTWKSF